MARARRFRNVPLLLKILLGLGVCLLVASTVTNFLEPRLTRSALHRQSRELAESQLHIVAEAYNERERLLGDVVRNLANELFVRGLTDPARRAELNVELGVSHRNRHLDLLEVIDAAGSRPVPPAGLVSLRAPLPAVREHDSFDATSRLVRSSQGTFVQVVATAVGSGPDRLVLAGGYEFGDALAYRLRRQVGQLGDVLLVADNRLAGSTLRDPPAKPPSLPQRTSLPSSPVVVPVPGDDLLVVYRPVSRQPGTGHGGALGVALSDPTATLDESLARNRLIMSFVLGATALIVGWLLFRALIRPLGELADTAGEIAAGNHQATFEARGRDEIARLATSLAIMTEDLQGQARGLSESARRIVAAQAQERQRIERNLHDGAQQRLVTASLALGTARTREAAHADPALDRDLGDLARHLDLALAELRALARGIHPTLLTEEGLAPALESLAQGSAVATEVDVTDERFPPPVEATAYFVVSEAMANVAKHSRAEAARVSLARRGDRLVVEVTDHGVGGADPAAGSGLVGLSDRVAALGGSLAIDSPEGGGTRLRAELPCA